jgi:dUTP pyrophosphatase
MTTAPGEIRVQVVRLRRPDRPLPRYQTAQAAGLDLEAAVESDVAIGPGRRALVPTGLAIALPAGYEGQVRPRSGLALKYGVTVLNAPGTIDADYRGEIGVVLINLGDSEFVVRDGDRIAQLVVAPVSRVSLLASDAIESTARGEGGYGSTGR